MLKLIYEVECWLLGITRSDLVQNRKFDAVSRTDDFFFLHWGNPHRIPCSLHRERTGRSIGLTYMRETREFKEHIQ